MLIIDCHCHAGEGDGLTGPWDTRAPLKKFMQWSTEAGIQKTVLFAAFHTDYAKANAQTAQIVGRYPARFYGFAFVHAERDRGRIHSMVQTAVEEYGFCGIKVHRHDARISREICTAARTFNIPVLYDPTGETSTIELIATEYRDVNFIIPHLSSFADDWRAQLAFLDLLARHPNVYTDTSGVRRFDLLEMAYQRAGASKILFGTDGPWLHPAVEIAKIYALKAPQEDLQLMLGENFLKLTSKVKTKQSAY
ncbi:amidohydrolase family protein [Runella sp. CRIBMP]|uniref:amidohydrolase family protein n=1 Tax=Runella sp. CRIBMP TaxID=2683261 RepID=UPI0014133608|nr:amidohydrolase family protein [Runella sp. CRIBMP]NBB22093.1 amidohydrolase family protein [Runella sp. CRIBMP]